MIGGDDNPNGALGRPFIMSAFISTTPSFPNPGTSLPVLALTAIKRPSSVPKNSSGGDSLSPAQYSRPRVANGPPPIVVDQISFPVSGSSATTRLYDVVRYITPFTTNGVTSHERPAPPRPRPRRPTGACASASAGFM